MIAATNNKYKLKEIREILNEYPIYSLKDKGIDIDIIEDQDTFLGNAKKKAIAIYNISKEPTIADDSGLCINCLDNFPGVKTNRFLGDDATDRMKNEYLIKEVNKHKNRSAKAVCIIVYYDGNNIIIGEGTLKGTISKKCKGTNGFGFDEIFELPNGLTLAELSSEEKNKLSARYLALKDLKKKIPHTINKKI
ncbi:MAG: RdgB/HAM1 family non-canonical purine NTP pyrophosphatase [Bacilli bacterium]|nr:RdgB/HAM1 family non-canonical purine NTP pyrophosphatase [Bacilli bacterium]